MKPSISLRRVLLPLLAASVLLALNAFGQGITTSALTGFVANKSGAPVAGAKVLAVLEPFMETEFADARRQGRREQPDAYRADALVRARSGSTRG